MKEERHGKVGMLQQGPGRSLILANQIHSLERLNRIRVMRRSSDVSCDAQLRDGMQPRSARGLEHSDAEQMNLNVST